MQERRPYDLRLSNVGYIVVRDLDDRPLPESQRPNEGVPRWRVETIPVQAQQAASIADVPFEWTTWHAGFGMGEASVPGMYHYAEGMDCRWPGVALMAPLVTTISTGGSAQISDIFETNSQIFCLGGRYCYHVKSDDTVETISGADGSTGKDFGAGAVATKAMEFDAKIYVGFSSATKIWEFASGTTWTQATDDVQALYWCKEYTDTYGWRLWRGYSTTSVQGVEEGTSPLTAANWGPSTAWTVGDTSHAITDMVAGGLNRLYVCKTNGLYALDYAGRNPNLLEQVEWLYSANTGKNALHDGAGVLFPHGHMGLLRYDENNNSVTSVHPGDMASNRSPVRGVVTAQTLIGDWHYVAIYNGTDSYLMAGRYPTAGEQMPAGWVGPKIWHPLAKLTAVQCDCMKPSGLQSVPRLYFGHGPNVAYIRLPKGGNVVSELGNTNLTFAASGSLYLSPTDWGNSAAYKDLMGFEIENESVSVSNPIVVYVRLDGGGWQRLGRAQVAGRSSLYIPTGTWRTHRAEFRLDVTNGTSTASVKIKPVVARASVKLTTRKLVTTTVYCQDDVLLRDGNVDRLRTGKALLDHLNELESSGPITLESWWTGRMVQELVNVHRVTPTIVKQKGNRAVGYGAEVVLSIIREQPATWYWDSGTLWESGAKWG